jgi:hypothetical protein
VRPGTLTDSKGFSENSGLGKREYLGKLRLHKGNIARKSLVRDITAGSQERNWDFCYSVEENTV